MIDYLLVMMLQSGEIVRSEVPVEYCVMYVDRLKAGEAPTIDNQLVVMSICAPKVDIEKAFPAKPKLSQYMSEK